tara:strand:+ start:119 stop:382 length:264 start_codon:yes stop_codon:yes gene_type:complete
MTSTLSPFHHNIRIILENTSYDMSMRDLKEVRSKVRILKKYIKDDKWDTVEDFQIDLANHIFVSLNIIKKMWPQIADGMIASESDYQ